MRKPKFQVPTGMHDILPKDQPYFDKVYDVVSKIVDSYGFSKIVPPVLEQAELFSKGIGLATDIVEKEMYTLKTKGGNVLAMRPEFTAGIVRAYIEHGMFNQPQPLKLFSFGPVFRAERPQAGRYRQFHQFDLEVFGEASPAVDAQIMQICYNILQELKIKDVIIEINSIGDSQCRPYYKKLLVNYLRSHQTALCADCKRRLRKNPLRILDCKEEKCQRVKASAPQIIDHLCQECNNHFKEVLEFLDALDLPYRLNPCLVRGLDYYTKTVFEIFKEGPAGESQVALLGGGRLDNLVRLLGGKETPVCGVAGGVERIVGLMKAKKIKLPVIAPAQIFLAQIGISAKRKSLGLFEDFRKAGIKVVESFGRDSLKAQLGRAQKLGVKYTLILGQKEVIEGTVIIRDMEKGRQKSIKLDRLVREIKRKLKT